MAPEGGAASGATGWPPGGLGCDELRRSIIPFSKCVFSRRVVTRRTKDEKTKPRERRVVVVRSTISLYQT
eukprot:31551-Pelagococcus_subviridis.AAC.16